MQVFDFARKPIVGCCFLAFRDSGFGRFVIPSTARFAVRGTAMSQPRDDRQDDLFRPALEEIINLRHPLVRLAAEIDWGFSGGTVRFGLSRRAWAAAIADAAGGWAVHSQAHAQSVRREAVRPVGGDPVFSVLLRRSGVPPRGAVRSLVVNALATATG